MSIIDNVSSRQWTIETAIRIDGLCKKFKNIRRYNTILNSLDLHCGTGQIYVLYGAVKSGKTTLMRILLSLCSPDAGTIFLFGENKPSKNITVGYMPQQLGLEGSLTVHETFYYFARLQGIDNIRFAKNEIELKILLGMLNLDVPVWTLQEHQKRMLSFSVALMSEPNILILDEPTSGCDPIYKHFIWKLIRDLVVDQRMTVLLSSSDETECEKADVMGYLRNGKIIAEDSPTFLMNKYNVTAISDLLYCFAIGFVSVDNLSNINLSRSAASLVSGGFITTNDSNLSQSVAPLSIKIDQVENVSKIYRKHQRKRKQSKILFPKRTTISQRLWTLFSWQFLLVFRNLKHIVWHTVMPILCLLVYFFSVKGDIRGFRLGIVIVNSTQSRSLLPAGMIKYIDDKYVEKIYFKTYEEALDHGIHGNLHGIVTFIADDSSDNGLRIRSKNIIVNQHIDVAMDVTSKIVSCRLVREIEKAYDRFKAQDAEGFRYIDNPIKQAASFLGNDDDTEVVRLIWGAVTVTVHFFGILIGALPLAAQHKSAVLDRFYLLGITKNELLLVHWLSRLCFAIIPNLTIQIVVLCLINQYLNLRNILFGFLVTMGQTACGISFGVFLFWIFNREVPILLCAVIVEILLATVSGFLWHYASLPDIFKLVCMSIPHYTVAEALNAGIIKNLENTSVPILLGVMVPFLWTSFFSVIYFIFNYFNNYS